MEIGLPHCSASNRRTAWSIFLKISITDTILGEPFGWLKTGLSNHQPPRP